MIPQLIYRIDLTTNLLSPQIHQLKLIDGCAHITGGGIAENLPRCIPDGLTANVWYDRYPLKSFKSPDVWHIPNIFYQIVSSGQIIEEEMKNIFNLGIGFCLVVPKIAEYDVHKSIHNHGYNSWTIGKVAHI